MRIEYVFILSLLLLGGCSSEKSSGPINAMVIHYSGAGCKFAVSEQPITTLDSVTEMRGAVGRVVRSDLDIQSKPEILDEYFSMRPVDVQFAKSGSSYGALDSDSLFALSLYYSIEQSYLAFQKYGVDFNTVVPNLSETRIVHEAKSTYGSGNSKKEIHDNAEFLANRYQANGQLNVKNFFFSYPNVEVKDVPLGLNVGVMAHEFSHLVFHWQFFENAYRNLNFVNTTKPTENTLAALDEGLADYFGFMTSGDPSFFLCSYPGEDRGLSKSKSFTPSIVQAINSTDVNSFDSHDGGAVWAAIQYEIGNKIGHETNAKSLVQLMSYLATCSDTANGKNISADFGDIAKCHYSLLNTRTDANGQATEVRSIYQKYLGSYGGRF